MFIEDAAFDAAAEVFGEIAVDLPIDVADFALGIEFDPRGGGLAHATDYEGRCDQGGVERSSC